MLSLTPPRHTSTLRIAVVHGDGSERPLSRECCASTPIGFDRSVQAAEARVKA